MKQLRLLVSSLAFLIGATALTSGAMIAYIYPMSAYIADLSVSVMNNFYLLGGFMALVMVSSLAQAGLVIRLIWGKAALANAKALDNDEDDMVGMRAMRATGTKKSFILLTLIAANTLLFDQIGRGVVVSDTRAYRVLTLLRSEDGQDRADAVYDTILLAGDNRIAEALQRVLEAPGEAREWVAYAAGARNDQKSADTLLRLTQIGTAKERAAAVVALARLKDYRLLRIVSDIYPHLGELKGDLIKAMGMLGKTKNTSESDLETAGTFLAEQLTNGTLDKELTRLAIWALGRFEAPQGLNPIEKRLESAGDSATLCTGLEALGRIGAADSSPKLIETIYKVDRSVQCPEIVYADFTGHEVLICTSINLTERLLHEIAHIGDRRARPDMEKLSHDESFSRRVRNLAGEIVFQMKYKPLP
ncbi:MAG: HEAT repeat domain-containing protein [Proteobacteria bacterium]|nr:HEAT repeat domain-containing protein [Pseudomonadota bacterium]